ncbi:winged helix DNA-binding domain-containing protein [Kitasatospora sp. MBT63]|uniref:winged helix DNA-binding domain-containing protein n=1 Tax=Kitasatospora sp. MBT63 TaxID=1444768 RepID=UPI00068DFA60|nr:winged helix DNA-binding domain-containing protein [Kitasatospora sp. MBT63]
MGPRELGRALLARQHLLERSGADPLAMIRHLVGLQAQAAPEPPYLGLLSRIEGLRPEHLTAPIEDRRVVRIALQRGTIHLVTAEDCLTLRPLLQPVLDRGFGSNWAKRLPGVDLDRVTARARALVEAEPMTFQHLGAELAGHEPGADPAALAQAARCRLPLVQVPPRGLWGRGGPAAHTTAEHWLGRPLDPAPAPDAMVLRYLAAFGPAGPADVQKWCGLTGLAAVLKRLAAQLVTFRDRAGRTLYDLPDAPRPDASVPAPVRLLAPFDNLLLSHADRTRVLPEEYRPRIMTQNGIVLGSVLVDGQVAGAWRTGDDGVLRVRAFTRLGRADLAGVEREGARVLAFGGDDRGRVAVEQDG